MYEYDHAHHHSSFSEQRRAMEPQRKPQKHYHASKPAMQEATIAAAPENAKDPDAPDVVVVVLGAAPAPMLGVAPEKFPPMYELPIAVSFPVLSNMATFGPTLDTDERKDPKYEYRSM